MASAIRPQRHEAEVRDDTASSVIHGGVAALAFVTVVALLGWHVMNGRPESLQLHYNPYAFLSAASLLSTLVAFALIVTKIKQRTDVLLWFMAFLLSIAAWAASEMMLRFSATPAAAGFWAALTTPGSVFMPVTLYMFVLAYTRPRYALQWSVLPMMLGAATLFVYLDGHTDLIALYDTTHMASSPWGYILGVGPAYPLITMWAVALPLAALLLLHEFRRRTIEPTLRRQAQLFMVAIAIPLVGGGITDGLLPILGMVVVPPLSAVLLTVMGVTICYGIIKYKFFDFTPSLVADEILGTMSEAVFGVQPDMRIAYANPGAEQLLGMPAAKLAGKRLSDFFAERADAKDFSLRLADVLKDGDFGTINSVELAVADRTRATAKLSVTKLRGANQPYGYLVVMTDITSLARAAAIVERKVAERTRELHEEQAKLRASIEGLPLGFLLVDEHRVIMVQNTALQRIFGLRHTVESVEQLNERLVNVDLVAECAAVQKSHRPRDVKEAGVGTKILHMYINPVMAVEHGREMVIGTVVLVDDITEEKVLARSKDEFFSIASHELRTPLTAIKGNASMMLQYFGQVFNKEESLKSMVVDIYESSGRLIDIVRDFLDVSRIEQGKMAFRFEAFPIEKVIESVLYELNTVAAQKKVDLGSNMRTLGELPLVWADRDRVTQIIYNLVGNAVKFTDAGSIRVHVGHGDRHIQVRVIDTGRGISPENQKLLFRKFQQAGKSLLTRDTTRGTGLGLYISKLMAEKMDCKIGLEHSREGKGSVFYLNVPVARAEQVHAAVRGAPKHEEKVDIATGLSKE